VGKRFETYNHLGRLDIDSVNVEIVRTVNLGSVKFRSAHEYMDQPIRVKKTRVPHVLE
jgi:hypothetical protein